MGSSNVLGYAISADGLQADVDRAWEMMKKPGTSHYMACANPHSLIVAAADPQFADALHSADILLPDGAGILLAGRILRSPFTERVAGFEFFSELSRRANEAGGVRYFFLGSTEEVLAKITERMAIDYPGIELAGTYSPPFRPEFDADDLAGMAAAIRAARPDVVWVGMTAPKQEKWIHEHGTKTGVPMIGAIGAVFDFYAGTVKRAPAWVGRLGLEWLPRLLREPRRLWRRNFVSSPAFLLKVLKQAVSPKTA